MTKYRVVRLTQEELKVQCKNDDYEMWGAATLDLAQYQRRAELKRATPFSQRGTIFWALVERSDDEEDSTSDKGLMAGQTLLVCHCESNRFDCVLRRSSGDVERGYSHHIGAVYTLPQFRNRGLASFFLSEVAKQLAQLPEALASVLYSDIGPKFYDKLGWRVHPSKTATLGVTHPQDANTDDSIRDLELSDLILDDNFDALLKADNEKIVGEILGAQFEGRESFVMLPTRDTTEWQFCMGVYFAQAKAFDELPSRCGVKLNEDAFIVWCHNYLKEPTLFIVRARFPDSGDDADVITRALLNEALKEARKFKIERVEIWDPPVALLHAIRRHFEVDIFERENALPSAMVFRHGGVDVEGAAPLPLWLHNEKYAWV